MMEININIELRAPLPLVLNTSVILSDIGKFGLDILLPEQPI
jgi:hypothetical protein